MNQIFSLVLIATWHDAFPYFGLNIVPSWIFRPMFWAYATILTLFAISVSTIAKNEASQTQGVEKFIPFGRVFFAFPIGIFGVEHLAYPQFAAPMIPAWIPGHYFWAYFTGIALIAGAVSVVIQKNARRAAMLLGILFLLFVLLMHIPRTITGPDQELAFNVVLRDLSFSGGAFAFAATQTTMRRERSARTLVSFARFFIGIPVIIFGVEHFLRPNFAPGIPEGKVMPSWIPAPAFLSYLFGTVLILAGLSLATQRHARMASTWLGIVILLLILIVYLPPLLANPADIGNRLNYVIIHLMLGGGVFILASTLPREAPRAEAVYPDYENI